MAKVKSNSSLKKCERERERIRKKITDLVVNKQMRYFDVAQAMGPGWTINMIGKRCQAYGITNGLHGGQFEIPPEELETQFQMLNKGYSHGEITRTINKKFNKNYTASALKYRARSRGWKSKNKSAGNFAKWLPDEVITIKTLYKESMPAPVYVRSLPGRSWDAIRKKILELRNLGQLDKIDPLPKVAMKELKQKLQLILKGGNR